MDIEFVTPDQPGWYYDSFTTRPHGFYFWNDKGGCCGPYPTEEECKEAMQRYEDHYP